MKIIDKIALCFLLIPALLRAQVPDTKSHEAAADSFKRLYNARRFVEIYTNLSEKFRSTIKEAEFVNFLEKNIYEPYGQLEKQQYLSPEKDHHSFICSFQNGKLQMNLTIGSDNKIEGLEFLPYSDVPKTKNLNYLSDNKKAGKLDSVVDAVVSKFIQSTENCGISIGVSLNGEDYFYNYGEVTRNSGMLPNPRSIYEIGSLTKTFCGLLLANAVVEKKISLDDDIRKYLPGNYPRLIFGKTFIKIKHLANHTSGLMSVPDDMMHAADFDSLNPYKNYSGEMILKYLKKSQPAQEPGTVCNYSNMGMALLGIILEKIYDKSFETLVIEKICEPNQMSSTIVNLRTEQLNRFADGHNFAGKLTPHWDLNGFRAAGGLKSDAEDMLKYLKYNLSEKDSATKLAHRETFSSREKVGLAWFIKKTNFGNTMYWHNGATYGFGAFAAFIKEKNCSLVILANSSTSVDFIGIAILKYLQQ